MLTNKDYCNLELTTILQEVGMPYYTNGAEFIDALFNMCVTLKEEGVI